jgi:Tfp pilus assembly protein PilN
LTQPPDFDLRRDAAAMAVALEAACPGLGWKANLLPANRRRSNSRWMFAPTAVLLAALALLSVGLLVRPVMQDASYVRAMQAEIDRLNRIVGQVNAARQETAALHGRLSVLRQLELRTERDLRILSELSRIIPTQAWVSDLEINDEGVRITGEAAEAAPLLGVLDQSANLTGAAFATSLTRIDEGERFQIVAKRRAAEGEAPPAAAAAQAEPPARIEPLKPVTAQSAASEAEPPAESRRAQRRQSATKNPPNRGDGRDQPGPARKR